MAEVSKFNLGRDLVIDEENIGAYNNAIRWMLRAPDFEGDLNKGLMFRGTPGSGKTHLMRLVSLCMPDLRNPFPIVTAQKLVDLYVEGGDPALANYRTMRILGIDDLGDEESAKRYGNDNEVLVRFHERRYDYGLVNPMVTLCTTNLGKEGLMTRYKERSYDRMRQLYNPIVLNREVSFRQTETMAQWKPDQL